MNEKIQKLFPPLKDVAVVPSTSRVYAPPIQFGGSQAGHTGEGDLFMMLEKGAMFVVIGKEPYILRPGQLAFLPDGVFRAYTPTVHDYTLYTYTMRITTEGQNLFRFLNLTAGNYVVTVPSAPDLAAHFRRASTRLAKPDSTLYLKNVSDAIEIATAYVSARILEGHVEKPFENVVRYMEENLGGDFTLDDFARLANVHPTHFIRKFKAHYSVAPMHYYAELRLQKALELLGQDGMSISAVGRAVGFSDKYYFIKFFQRLCGLSPDAYRKLFRQTS